MARKAGDKKGGGEFNNDGVLRFAQDDGRVTNEYCSMTTSLFQSDESSDCVGSPDGPSLVVELPKDCLKNPSSNLHGVEIPRVGKVLT